MSILDTVNINRDIDDITMTRGDTLAYGFMVNGIDEDVPLDDATFSVKTDKNDEEYVFQLKLGDDIRNEGGGVYSVRARPELTANLEPNVYFYDLEIVVGSDKFTIMQGKLNIRKGITED